jgi:putative FmdB family regulatory protein
VPTYDYRCRECGHTIEIMHSILEDGPDACERCRGPVDRVVHPAGVIFRGSGFYVTDSRRSSAPTEGSGDGGGGTDGAPTASPKATDSPSAKGKSEGSGSGDGRSGGGSD